MLFLKQSHHQTVCLPALWCCASLKLLSFKHVSIHLFVCTVSFCAKKKKKRCEKKPAPLCFQRLGWRCRRPTVPSHQPWGRCQTILPSCRETCCCTRLHSDCAAATRCESGNGTEPKTRTDNHLSVCLSEYQPSPVFHPVSYQDVALVFVVVQGSVVNHMPSSCPGVRQQMLHKVLSLCEITHGSVLQHTPALVVAVHRPHLMERGREKKRVHCLHSSDFQTHHGSKSIILSAILHLIFLHKLSTSQFYPSVKVELWLFYSLDLPLCLLKIVSHT